MARGRGKRTDTHTGGDVFTSDGECLGKVWDVRDASFQVDVPFESQYWLPFNSVESADGERVVLNFPKKELGRYISAQPLIA